MKPIPLSRRLVFPPRICKDPEKGIPDIQSEDRQQGLDRPTDLLVDPLAFGIGFF